MSSNSECSESSFASTDGEFLQFAFKDEFGNEEFVFTVSDKGSDIEFSLRTGIRNPEHITLPKYFLRDAFLDDIVPFVKRRAHLRKHVTPEVVTWGPVEGTEDGR